MQCPHCGARLNDATETWHTLTQAQGAEYLAAYVTIWHCSKCDTVAGERDGTIEWVMEPEGTLEEN